MPAKVNQNNTGGLFQTKIGQWAVKSEKIMNDTVTMTEMKSQGH